MLIYLTNSLIVDEKDTRLDDIKRCAKYLAMAMIEHNHIVRGDYEVLEWLAETMAQYDNDSYNVYTRLSKRFSTYVIPSCLHYYVKVFIEMPTIDFIEENEVKIKSIHYSYFLDSSKVQAMPFIGEDTADCDFYIHIANNYLSSNNFNLILSCRKEKGNGSGVVKVTSEYVKAHKPIICIVDSDKKYPNQPIDPNTTYAKCRNEWDTYPVINEIFCFHVVQTQEIENLIPYNYIDNLGLWDGQCKANKEAYDILYNNENREIILCYYDLKNGLKKNDAMNKDEDYLNYVIMCYSCFNPNCDRNLIKSVSTGNWLCAKLHGSLLKLINDYIMKHDNLHPQLLKFQKKEWNDVGAILLDMCCAGKEEFL